MTLLNLQLKRELKILHQFEPEILQEISLIDAEDTHTDPTDPTYITYIVESLLDENPYDCADYSVGFQDDAVCRNSYTIKSGRCSHIIEEQFCLECRLGLYFHNKINARHCENWLYDATTRGTSEKFEKYRKSTFIRS
jgi:hypothetical protein